jgi:multidrug efflux pump
VGTGVIGGMLASTFLAIFFVPLFFVVVLGWFKVKPGHLDPEIAVKWAPEGPT